MQKRVLLGVGGGIAAYKTPELARLLVQRGYQVQAVLSPSAVKFVTPTTLQAVTNRRVRDDLWDDEAERSMSHIELARWADVCLIAPATASMISRLSLGYAPDLLSTIYLATTADVFIAPAMNHRMWKHPATQRQLRQLQNDGVQVIGPDVGDQACGEYGPGRMSSPIAIADFLDSATLDETTLLEGKKVLITAGPTREAVDPVRYISNSSSGRQGFALAEQVRNAGADVTLICGPVSLDTPARVERVDVVTAAEMKFEVMHRIEKMDLFFAVAAVADYRLANPSSTKIKKHLRTEATDLTLRLTETDDIVKAVSALPHPPYMVGFAAETDDVVEFGRAKRIRKKLDAIVINDVSSSEIGFESLDNEVTVITDSGEFQFPKAPKAEIARRVIEVVAREIASSQPELSPAS